MSHDAAEPAVEYDPIAAPVLADPAPSYADLRARCPVHRFDGLENPLYSLSRRDDVQAVLTDPSAWSNRFGPGISYSDDNVGDLQRYDPPDHGIRRRFVRDVFLPRAVDALGPSIETAARDLIVELAPRGRAELHDEFALPLPIRGFVDLMGIDPDDGADFKGWADELTVAMTFPDRARVARRAMAAYTIDQVRQRRRAREAGAAVPPGLLSHLACDPLEDGTLMPDHEVAGMVGQLLVAGHETTTSLIANAVWRLLEDRSRWDRLVREPELVPNVIEESLRFDPPVLGLCKTNNSAVTIHDVDIPADSKVMVLYASANRDEGHFVDPDTFRLDRPLLESKRHLSFGWGTHFCLGAHLARLTGRLALEALVAEVPGLRLDGSTERVEAPFLWGRRRLPVAWD